MYRAWLLFVLGVLAAACEENSEPFLPLSELCPERTAAICAARSRGCSEDEVDPACLKHEAARCEALSDTFEAEDRLIYDSVAALRVRQEEQASLDVDEAPLPLARYFEGGLADDEECERDSQCESGYCGPETGLCESHPELTLCEPE